MSDPVDALEVKLRMGKWRTLCFLDSSRGGTQIWRSVADPRVTAARFTPKRGRGEPSVTYQFGDAVVTVSLAAGGSAEQLRADERVIVSLAAGASAEQPRADARSFSSLRALCEAVVAHDAQLARAHKEAAKRNG